LGSCLLLLLAYCLNLVILCNYIQDIFTNNHYSMEDSLSPIPIR
jgi:hypothetical protein